MTRPMVPPILAANCRVKHIFNDELDYELTEKFKEAFHVENLHLVVEGFEVKLNLNQTTVKICISFLFLNYILCPLYIEKPIGIYLFKSLLNHLCATMS